MVTISNSRNSNHIFIIAIFLLNVTSHFVGISSTPIFTSQQNQETTTPYTHISNFLNQRKSNSHHQPESGFGWTDSISSLLTDKSSSSNNNHNNNNNEENGKFNEFPKFDSDQFQSQREYTKDHDNHNNNDDDDNNKKGDNKDKKIIPTAETVQNLATTETTSSVQVYKRVIGNVLRDIRDGFSNILQLQQNQHQSNTENNLQRNSFVQNTLGRLREQIRREFDGNVPSSSISSVSSERTKSSDGEITTTEFQGLTLPDDSSDELQVNFDISRSNFNNNFSSFPNLNSSTDDNQTNDGNNTSSIDVDIEDEDDNNGNTDTDTDIDININNFIFRKIHSKARSFITLVLTPLLNVWSQIGEQIQKQNLHIIPKNFRIPIISNTNSNNNNNDNNNLPEPQQNEEPQGKQIIRKREQQQYQEQQNVENVNISEIPFGTRIRMGIKRNLRETLFKDVFYKYSNLVKKGFNNEENSNSNNSNKDDETFDNPFANKSNNESNFENTNDNKDFQYVNSAAAEYDDHDDGGNENNGNTVLYEINRENRNENTKTKTNNSKDNKFSSERRESRHVKEKKFREININNDGETETDNNEPSRSDENFEFRRDSDDLLENMGISARNSQNPRFLFNEGLGIYILEIVGTIAGLTWGAISQLQSAFGMRA